MTRDLFDPPEMYPRPGRQQPLPLTAEERRLLARIRLARIQSLGLRDDSGE